MKKNKLPGTWFSLRHIMLAKVARLKKVYPLQVHLYKVQKQAKLIHSDRLTTVVTSAEFCINWEMA